MNILILNITIDWVYRLYKEYILSFQQFMQKYYNNITIEILFYDVSTFNIDQLNKINFKKYNKLFYSGDINILNKFIELNNINNIIENLFNDKNIYYINIEQLSHDSYYREMKKLNNNVNIIDYSEENIPYLENIYNYFLFPPFFKCKKIDYTKKTIDVLGIMNNEYRKSIYNNINIDKNFNKIFLDNCYGKERDNYFYNSKIYINIHASPNHKTMELLRIVNLIMNKVIVISQNTVNNELIFLKDYIIICNDDNNFSEYINEILINYEHYFHKIYDNFNETKYYNYIKMNIDKIFL